MSKLLEWVIIGALFIGAAFIAYEALMLVMKVCHDIIALNNPAWGWQLLVLGD